ncbi:MAG: type II toxin-antitoxin system VapC family toxin [Elusimicrobia bacterium]|nr:type II toxin-antitoxin system VapC family toxin [Candidatus Liberimonas magnetica]
MPGKDYLLDTNILGYLANLKAGETSDECKRLKANIDRISDRKMCLCPISAGEIEYGLLVNTHMDKDKSDQIRNILDLYPYFHIDRNIAVEYYAKLRALLFEKYSPKNRRSKVKRLEELVDPLTSKKLEIQENDAWICAVAMAYNLVLVTNDKMKPIKDIIGANLEFEDWLI